MRGGSRCAFSLDGTCSGDPSSLPAELCSRNGLLQVERPWSVLAELAGCCLRAELGCVARPCSVRLHACCGTVSGQGEHCSGRCYGLLRVLGQCVLSLIISSHHVVGEQ